MFWYFKIEIGLHSSAVGVWRHGIPNTPALQFGKAHLQLACGQYAIDQQLPYCAAIGCISRP